jgi:hypothetical protein
MAASALSKRPENIKYDAITVPVLPFPAYQMNGRSMKKDQILKMSEKRERERKRKKEKERERERKTKKEKKRECVQDNEQQQHFVNWPSESCAFLERF